MVGTASWRPSARSGGQKSESVIRRPKQSFEDTGILKLELGNELRFAGDTLAPGIRKSRDAEGFVGVGIVHQCAGREAADVDDEFGVVRALDEAGFVGDWDAFGEGFGRLIGGR